MSFDYTAAQGFEGSFIDSTMRLGANWINLIVILDLDRSYNEKSVTKKIQVVKIQTKGFKW